MLVKSQLNCYKWAGTEFFCSMRQFWNYVVCVFVCMYLEMHTALVRLEWEVSVKPSCQHADLFELCWWCCCGLCPLKGVRLFLYSWLCQRLTFVTQLFTHSVISVWARCETISAMLLCFYYCFFVLVTLCGYIIRHLWSF